MIVLKDANGRFPDTNGAIFLASLADALISSRRGVQQGLKQSNNGTDAVNDVDIAAGYALSDDLKNRLALPATHVKQIDVAFTEYTAIGTASGGRDSADNLTGAKWFRNYLVGGSGKNDQCFLSTSDTPTLPSGFTAKQRIGWLHWDGSTIRGFVQTGDKVEWKSPVLDYNTTNPGTARVVATLTVPPNSEALINVQLVTGAGGASALYVMNPAVNDEAPSDTVAPLSSLRAAASETRTLGPIRVQADASSRVAFKLSFSDASTIVRIATIGYVERRGRDD